MSCSQAMTVSGDALVWPGVGIILLMLSAFPLGLRHPARPERRASCRHHRPLIDRSAPSEPRLMCARAPRVDTMHAAFLEPIRRLLLRDCIGG
jgi:hypothetical protein